MAISSKVFDQKYSEKGYPHRSAVNFLNLKMGAHARVVMVESFETESVYVIIFPLQIESCRTISFIACLLIAVYE